MRLKFLIIFFMGHGIMILGCKSNIDKSGNNKIEAYEVLQAEFKKNAEKIPGFTFDSIVYSYTLLKFYVTDSLDHFNHVLIEQKIIYSLHTLIKSSESLPAASEIYVKMPNRHDPNTVMEISTVDLLKSLELFKNSCFEKAIENIYYLQIQNPSINYIDNLNTEFAFLIHHENVTKEAFFGVDSYKIIYGYLSEKENKNSKVFHNLFDSLKISYSEQLDNKKFIENLINDLDTCVKN